MLKIGDVIYDCGDNFGPVFAVRITAENYTRILRLLNVVYFSDRNEAFRKNALMRGKDTEYQFGG